MSSAPSCCPQRGQHSPQCNQLHQGWLAQAQGRDNTFDLLQLGLYVPLTLFLGLHQEIDLLFFRENIIGINLPRQNPSDNPLAQVTAWPCSSNPLQESQVWVALGRFNNTGKKKSSSCLPALIFPSSKADADPKPPPTLSMVISAHVSVQKSVACQAPAPALCHPPHQQCWVSLLPTLSSPGQVWQSLGKVPDQGSANQPVSSARSRHCNPWHLQPPHHTTCANVFWGVLG